MKDEQKTKKELIAEIKEMRSLVMNLSEVQDVVANERRKSQEKQLQFLQNAIDSVADSIIVVASYLNIPGTEKRIAPGGNSASYIIFNRSAFFKSTRRLKRNKQSFLPFGRRSVTWESKRVARPCIRWSNGLYNSIVPLLKLRRSDCCFKRHTNR